MKTNTTATVGNVIAESKNGSQGLQRDMLERICKQQCDVTFPTASKRLEHKQRVVQYNRAGSN